MPEIISRKEAKALGLKRYFTGKPCKRGHLCERRIAGSSGACVICAKLNCREFYYRHHEKMKKRGRGGWRKLTEESRLRAAENKRIWRARNLTRLKMERRAKYHKNKMNPGFLMGVYEKRRKQQESDPTLKARYEASKLKYVIHGPRNPKDAKQWLSKAKAMNRNLRRLIRKPNLDHSSWLRLDPET